jgi:hypothetical protein
MKDQWVSLVTGFPFPNSAHPCKQKNGRELHAPSRPLKGACGY